MVDSARLHRPMLLRRDTGSRDIPARWGSQGSSLPPGLPGRSLSSEVALPMLRWPRSTSAERRSRERGGEMGAAKLGLAVLGTLIAQLATGFRRPILPPAVGGSGDDPR